MHSYMGGKWWHVISGMEIGTLRNAPLWGTLRSNGLGKWPVPHLLLPNVREYGQLCDLKLCLPHSLTRGVNTVMSS